MSAVEECEMLKSVPWTPRLLGIAGLLPMAAAVIVALFGDLVNRWTAAAAGYAYAALVFSFLGGLWWGLASMRQAPPAWIYGVAILPAGVAFASYMPWIFGWAWPGPSLVVLGLGIALSPLVDRAIAQSGTAPPWWMALRWTLSMLLGAMALTLAALVPSIG